MTKQQRPIAASLHVSIGKSNQDVHYVEILSMPAVETSHDHRLRVRIRSNAYKFQSHALIERWSGEAWHEVYTLTPGTMQTREGLYLVEVADRERPPLFQADRDQLIARASEILQ